MGFNDTDDYSLGFINDDPNGDEGNMDDLASSPSFEVVEEIKVNHGMFVSTRQAAETFFHQLVPSQTVEIHLNPAMTNNFPRDKPSVQRLCDTKSTICAKGKLMGINYKSIQPWRKLGRTVVCMIVILLMHCFYVGENVESEKLMDGFMGSGILGDKICPSYIKPNKKPGRITCDDNKEKALLVSIRGGGGSKLGVILKKLGLFLTISLALCTMWVNHVILTS